MNLKSFFHFLCATLGSLSVSAQPLTVTALDRSGHLSWANAFSNGVCTVEMAAALTGPWNPIRNLFTSNSVAQVQIGLTNRSGFYRLAAADISATPEGFYNLAASWSTLTTLAGKGEVRRDGLNNWQPWFEGGLAVEAELSRPHFAMSDAAGNVYIADKDAHAIRKVTPDGRLVTVAGTNVAGDDGSSPGPATQRRLSSPNGLWVRADGTFYVLDTGNEKIRRVDSNGQMTTLFSTDSFVPDRGLWVSDDETEAYFSAITSVVKWTPAAGRQVVAGGFVELGNLIVNSAGQLVVTDRGGHTVYLVQADGAVSPIAGNGDILGGGDGSPALETGLAGVRGVWPLPNGGYLLATHEGSQIWYLDTAGIIHLFVDGTGGAHSGDGEYFRVPGFKISEVRSVTLDDQGNILITENDYGFVRKIEFLRYVP